ncbi:MAG: hypothetical protein JWR44_1040 [Hymenobacter sp.]|jgi:hypothetical protein|nr:hypothetical protein [Hymenobacter sp.]
MALSGGMGPALTKPQLGGAYLQALFIKPFLVKPFFYCLLFLLSSCSVYHKVFHPYRLPTPKPSPEYKAQLKAKKEKEKGLLTFNRSKDKGKGGTSAGGDEAATDVSTPTGGIVTAPSAAPETRVLPERSTVRYDKKGLMKKPKMKRRRINKPAGKPFQPWQSIKHFFKFQLHAKPNYDPAHKPVPRVPAPDAEPPATPDAAPEPKP